MKDLARIFGDLTEALAAGGSLLLLTDYDGTLTPIVEDPTVAGLARVVRDDLHALTESPRVRVGVLSGRALDDLRTRIAVPRLIYAGCHGLEVRGPDLAFTHAEAEAHRGTLAAIAEALHVRADSIAGVRVEPKGLAVALHYRNIAPAVVGRIEVLLERVIHPWRRRLRLLRGKKVIEVLPRVRWGKGECALWIRDHLVPAGPSAITMLYMGDDRTDELAFGVLAGKAITVRVGPERTRSAAAYRLPGVADVHRLLSALAAEVGKS